jgi:hypothetical protein
LPAFAVRHGTTTSGAASLISVIGGCNIISRLCTGIATNHPTFAAQVLTIYFATNGLAGIVLLLAPLLMVSFVGQLITAGLFGIYANSWMSLMSPVTIELFGLENLSVCTGIGVFACGTGLLVAPPIAGNVPLTHSTLVCHSLFDWSILDQ